MYTKISLLIIFGKTRTHKNWQEWVTPEKGIRKGGFIPFSADWLLTILPPTCYKFLSQLNNLHIYSCLEFTKYFVLTRPKVCIFIGLQ